MAEHNGIGVEMYNAFGPFWGAILTSTEQNERWPTRGRILPVDTPFTIDGLTEDEAYDL
jgi:hypothetical protein